MYKALSSENEWQLFSTDDLATSDGQRGCQLSVVAVVGVYVCISVVQKCLTEFYISRESVVVPE